MLLSCFPGTVPTTRKRVEAATERGASVMTEGAAASGGTFPTEPVVPAPSAPAPLLQVAAMAEDQTASRVLEAVLGVAGAVPGLVDEMHARFFTGGRWARGVMSFSSCI